MIDVSIVNKHEKKKYQNYYEGPWKMLVPWDKSITITKYYIKTEDCLL